MVVGHCLKWQGISCVVHVARTGAIVSNDYRHEREKRETLKGSTLGDPKVK